MATRLYEVLTFANVAAGGMATLPHQLNVNGVPIVPDFLFSDAAGFSLVAADDASITVQNNNPGAATLDLALMSMFSIERYFGQGGPVSTGAPGSQVPQPFWVSGGGAGSAAKEQGFSYTVTGAEPDLANLVIPLPSARPSAAYNVQITPQTQAIQTTYNAPDADKTNNQFVLALGTDATAGDKFSFLIYDDFNTL
jgi:hypothetical protein